MEIDHIFICVKPGAYEAEALQEFGLTEGAANQHHGRIRRHGKDCSHSRTPEASVRSRHFASSYQTRIHALHLHNVQPMSKALPSSKGMRIC